MSNTVAERSDKVAAMVNAAAKGRALMSGTDGMRSKGETYLPKFESESKEAYEARRDSTFLFNGFKKTVKDFTGKVFDKPVELGEDAPDRLKAWCENVDLQGRDLSVFAKEVFEKGFAGGVSYIMVDAPRREEVVSKAEAEARNMRPYMVHLLIEDILGWKTATVDNVTVLTQLRIQETIEEDDTDEFTSKEVPQIRVLNRTPEGVRVRIYRETNKTWSVIEGGDYISQAPEITVIPFYAARTGYFTGEPVLDDLADVNIAHWQSQSDQRNILRAARVPILHAAGVDSDEAIVISSSQAIKSRRPDAQLGWVEHSGKAIEAGRQDLKDLEFQMETLGLQLLVARAQSATGEALDASKETSQLAAMADALKDALEQALLWMQFYGGLDQQSVPVKVNKEFGVSILSAQEMQVMLAAVNTGQLSQETFLREMSSRGFIRSDIDPADEKDRIDEEGGALVNDGGE